MTLDLRGTPVANPASEAVLSSPDPDVRLLKLGGVAPLLCRFR